MTEQSLRRGLLSFSLIAFAVGLVILVANISSCDPLKCDHPCHDGECCDKEYPSGPSYGTIGFSIVLLGAVGIVGRAFIPNPDKKRRT